MNHLRILCVDDDPALLRMLKTGLEYYGYEVVAACDGVEGVIQFREYRGRFGAIVTDRDMPEMNGIELAHMVRDEGFAGQIYVMSGSPAADDLADWSDLHLSGFLQKPFKVSQLTAQMLQNDVVLKN